MKPVRISAKIVTASEVLDAPASAPEPQLSEPPRKEPSATTTADLLFELASHTREVLQEVKRLKASLPGSKSVAIAFKAVEQANCDTVFALSMMEKEFGTLITPTESEFPDK